MQSAYADVEKNGSEIFTSTHALRQILLQVVSDSRVRRDSRCAVAALVSTALASEILRENRADARARAG